MSVVFSAWCRLVQASERMFRPRKPERQTVEEGTGAVFSVAQLMRGGRLRKPMVVSGPGTEALRERVLHALMESDIDYAVYDAPGAEPAEEAAEALRLAWATASCDCFIALGDGDTIDLVKIASALAAARGRDLMSLVGRDRLRRRAVPVTAIPTAAGSGAEALCWAQFADAGGRRYVIDDPGLLPAALVLDPELMESVPRPALASAAIDGLCLAVEAYLSGYGNEVSRACAADAVRGYFTCLEPCWNSGGTPAQRSSLMAASRLAGEAASAAGPGYIRALCRALRQETGGNSGDIAAAVLPAVLVKYGNPVALRLAELAEVTGLPATGTPAEGAGSFLDRLRQLIFRVGLPEAIENPGSGVLHAAAQRAAAEANPRYAGPVVWTEKELEQVLCRACSAPER